MTTWTVVTRRHGRGQFRKTGFEGTWAEAGDEGRRIVAEDDAQDVWLVTTTDTRVILDDGRTVGIAPTAEERAAAKAEEARVQATAVDLVSSWAHNYLQGDAHAILGVETDSPLDAAYALARAGWNRRMLGVRHS
jgi:hypothetical protein